MAIKKPEEMSFKDKNLFLVIAGTPGTGKTTLANSAPGVLLIDCDKGLSRVKPEHRRDASSCSTYEEILADIKSAEGVYKTIVIDTGGALIDFMKDWAIRTEPTASKKTGGISLQGFGVVKQEWLRLTEYLRNKFNVVCLFHEQKEKENEETFYSIVCEGAAKTLVYQPADLAGHLFIQNGKRYLGFTPTENYYAKAAYGIKGLVEIPELAEGEPNKFLTLLFDKIRKNLEEESSALSDNTKTYNEAMAIGAKLIEKVEKPEDVTVCLEEISKLNHALTSEKELKSALKKRMEKQKIVYNKGTNTYEYKQN